MNDKDLVKSAFDSIPADSIIFTSKLGDIADRVQQLLFEKGWSQKDLAKAMGKNESEISKWLTSIHNFTLKSITKMEAVLGADIINVPMTGDVSSMTNYIYLKIYAYSNESDKDIFENTPMSHEARKTGDQYLSVNAVMNRPMPKELAKPLVDEVLETQSFLLAS